MKRSYTLYSKLKHTLCQLFQRYKIIDYLISIFVTSELCALSRLGLITISQHSLMPVLNKSKPTVELDREPIKGTYKS